MKTGFGGYLVAGVAGRSHFYPSITLTYPKGQKRHLPATPATLDER